MARTPASPLQRVMAHFLSIPLGTARDHLETIQTVLDARAINENGSSTAAPVRRGGRRKTAAPPDAPAAPATAAAPAEAPAVPAAPRRRRRRAEPTAAPAMTLAEPTVTSSVNAPPPLDAGLPPQDVDPEA